MWVVYRLPLTANTKSSGVCSAQPFDGGVGGQAVEGVVDLDRVEDGRVVLEPEALRQLLGIELALPVLVDPARAADVDGLHGSVRAQSEPGRGSSRGAAANPRETGRARASVNGADGTPRTPREANHGPAVPRLRSQAGVCLPAAAPASCAEGSDADRNVGAGKVNPPQNERTPHEPPGPYPADRRPRLFASEYLYGALTRKARYRILSYRLKIGMYIEITMKPTPAPTNMIIIGSISDVRALTLASTSVS